MIASKYIKELQLLKDEMVNLQNMIGLKKQTYNLQTMPSEQDSFVRQIIGALEKNDSKVQIVIKNMPISIGPNSKQIFGDGINSFHSGNENSEIEKKELLEELVKYINENLELLIAENVEERGDKIGEIEDATLRITNQVKKEKLHSKIISSALATINSVLTGVAGNAYTQPVLDMLQRLFS